MENRYNESITNLKSQIEIEISKMEKMPSNIFRHFTVKALKSKKERLYDIEKILRIEKYKLAFIGKVGLGKTTAICHLFDLTNQVPVAPNAKKLKTQEILAISSGRTTLCEVELIPKGCEASYIMIDPCSEQEVLDDIDMFCNIIDKKLNPQNYDIVSTTQSEIPTELLKAIRNLVNLQEKTDLMIDEGEELAKKIFSEGKTLEDFKETVRIRANLAERIETKISFTSENLQKSLEGTIEISQEKEWLRDTFKKLNVVAHKQFSIPKNIYIYLSANIINQVGLSQIASIIDTKGLDGKITETIEKCIKEPDTLCLFITGYKQAPDIEIRKILIDHLREKSKNYHTKFILFVIPYKGEPENETDDNGDYIEDWNIGTEKRRKIIERILLNENVKLDPENIIFFDPLKYFDTVKRIHFEGTENEIHSEKLKVISQIDTIISKRKLGNELEVLSNDLQKIIQEKSFSHEEETIVNKTKSELLKYSFINFYSDEFISLFINDYKAYHHLTKRAINNYYGSHWRSGNIYFDAQEITKDVIRKITVQPQKEIEKIIDNLRIELEPKGLSFFAGELSENINKWLETVKLAPQNTESVFWNNIIRRWGMGRGYNDDVCSMLADKLRGANEYLQNTAQNLWRTEIIDKMSEFFGK